MCTAYLNSVQIVSVRALYDDHGIAPGASDYILILAICAALRFIFGLYEIQYMGVIGI